MKTATGYVALALGLLAALVLGACRDLVTPLPTGAQRFDPPPVYARWWALTEQCSRLSGSFASYSWYVVPGSYAPVASIPHAAAYTDVQAHRIVLAQSVRDLGGTVRHEVLHALLGRAYASSDAAKGHPAEYFVSRCLGVVDCGDRCNVAGPAPIIAPADAPLLPVADLGLDIELLTSPASLNGSDSIVTVIVRATNRTTTPVRVPLEGSPGIPEGYASLFSFAVAPVGQDTQYVKLVQSIPMAPVAFGAGQTRESILDVNLRGFRVPPGDYIVTGGFNTRQPVSAPLRVLP